MRVVKLLFKALLGFTILTVIASIGSAVAAALLGPTLRDDAEPEDDEIHVATVFDSRDFRSAATGLRGGRLVSWFGGLDVDLRGATLDPAGADLEVWSVFGGARVRVPQDWQVQLHGISAFGGAGVQGAEGASGDPLLRISHRSIFGGLGVIAEPDDELLAV